MSSPQALEDLYTHYDGTVRNAAGGIVQVGAGWGAPPASGHRELERQVAGNPATPAVPVIRWLRLGALGRATLRRHLP